MSLATSYTTPGTTIVTTAETVAANIPVSPVYEGGPGGGLSGIVVRGTVSITTGTGVTSGSVKLRTGQNNTTTGQIAQTETIPLVASLLQEIPFEFVDNSVPIGGNLNNLGYTITVTQNAATGNGAVTAVTWETDRSAA